MTDLRITHIRKKDSKGSHEHITHAGNPPNWFWTKEDIIRSIENKTNTFYVLDSKTGKRSEVGVVRPSTGEPYIRTHADGYWNDNLLALPEY